MVIFLFIFFLLFILYGFLINYYRSSWNALPEFSGAALPTTKISVIIAVRNEEKNIAALLNALASQDYPPSMYEVILVNDHSTDGTAFLVENHPHTALRLSFVQLEEGVISKKKAIAAGIAVADGELIVTTDADCIMGPYWLSEYAAFYQSANPRFIAAPVCMQNSGSLSGIFQSLDFLSLQGITGASVFKKMYAICNGANIAYPKKVFEEVKGFEGIDHIPSGDDMLLMQKVLQAYPDGVFYLKSKAAWVTTNAEPAWGAFLQQRIRWASKAVHYKDRRIFFVLLLTYLVNVGFVVLALAAFTRMSWLPFLLLFLLAKILVEFPFVNALALYFNTRKIMVWFPFLQPVHIIYIVVSGWLGRFGSYRWKSRTIKT